MRISDWSSDVCSSDLAVHQQRPTALRHPGPAPHRENAIVSRIEGIRAAEGDGIEAVELTRPLDPVPDDADLMVGEGAVHRFQARRPVFEAIALAARSEEHTSELQSLMRISYAVFCLKKKKT